MDEQQLEDLKQFIDGRVSQFEIRFEEHLEENLDKLRQEMLDGFAGVGEAIDEINKRFDERLSALEQHSA